MFLKSVVPISIREALAPWRRRVVRIDQLVCARFPQHFVLGYGGRSIDHFPPRSFFAQELDSATAGVRAFECWLIRRFMDRGEGRMPKIEGGMMGGSTSVAIRAVAAELGMERSKLPDDLTTLDQRIIRSGIALRVAQYFDVFANIRIHGYDYRKGYVHCFQSNHGDLEITGGHHRLAMLRAIGAKETRVIVYPSLGPHS